MLAMPEAVANIMATKELRNNGFTGTITVTVVLDDEVEALQQAGVDFIYNHYDGIGASFATNSMQTAATGSKT